MSLRGKAGQEALHAMGEAYRILIEDRERLQLMLQCFAAAEDPARAAGSGREIPFALGRTRTPASA